MGDPFFNLCEGDSWETIRMDDMGVWSHQYGFFPMGWKRCGREGGFSADLLPGKYVGLTK